MSEPYSYVKKNKNILKRVKKIYGNITLSFC